MIQKLQPVLEVNNLPTYSGNKYPSDSTGGDIGGLTEMIELKPLPDWWCPKCGDYVDGSHVTFGEIHEVCGTQLHYTTEMKLEISALEAQVATLTDAERKKSLLADERGAQVVELEKNLASALGEYADMHSRLKEVYVKIENIKDHIFEGKNGSASLEYRFTQDGVVRGLINALDILRSAFPEVLK